MCRFAGALVVAFPALVGCVHLQHTKSDIADLDKAYSHVIEQQRRASQLVAQLDREILILQTATEISPLASRVKHTSRLDLQAKAESLRVKEQELLDVDRAINTELKTLYTKAAADESSQTNESLVKTALTHWMVLLRRASMRSFHTEVDGLTSDPDCAGDIIGDELLQRYFDTLFQKNNDSAASAVTALIALARQSACLGTQQSALFASNLYSSYTELRSFLRLNGLDNVVPYVAQAAAGPLLLFYDVQKYRGPQSPLARWFLENQEVLIQGAAVKRHPATWHGLWLYDRRSGRLLGYKASNNPRDENEVNLALFYGSIASPENLGKYSCSFTEMIQRGANPMGYFCAGSSCKQKPSGNRTSTSILPRSGVGTIVISEELTTTVCQQSSGTGRDGGSGGGRACSGGLNIAGSNTAADTVSCLSQQVVHPGTEAFHCIAEATGLCSNPAGKFAKELQQTQFSGVKLGKTCQLQRDAGATADQKFEDAELQAYRDLIKAQAEAAHKSEDAITANEKLYKDDLAIENQDYVDLLNGCDNTIPCQHNVENDHKKEVEQIQQHRDLILQIIQAAEAAEKQKAKEDYDAKVKKAEQERDTEKGKQAGGQKGQRCPQETPECGNNNCTAMSEAAHQTLECVKQAINPDDRDPYETKPGGCNPQICDPIEPANPSTSALNKCFAPMLEDPKTVTSKKCWAVRCAAGELALSGPLGTCGCQGPETGTSVEGGLKNMCENVLCAEGSPTMQKNGACTCGPVGGIGTGSPPQPKGPFTLKSPTTFFDVNNRPGIGDILPRGGIR